MRDDDLTILGDHFGYGHQSAVPFGIRRADRRQHLYALGKSGTGKSTLLLNMLLQDIEAGEGVALLDPHGDLAERILDHIPRERTADVCYFDPADLGHPIGFNIVAAQPPDRQHLAVASVVASFKSFWGDSWGPRLEYILANGIAALMDRPRSTLLLLPRLLTDDGYRLRLADRLRDPRVRQFWAVEFEGYDKRLKAEATTPVLNKVGQLLMSPMMRNIFGQESNAFDPRFAMDRRKIFIANLAKGRIGESNANLLGSLLLSNFELAAQSRADTPEHDRIDFYLYVDEFQNFSTESFSHILSEARKYRLSLAIFHQFRDQLSEPIRKAVFGNVGTILSFRVGYDDADHLSREFENTLAPADFTDLDRFELAARILDHGRQSVGFKARTHPPTARHYGRARTIVEQSRRRFSRPREIVERHIEHTLGAQFHGPTEPPRRPRR